MEPTDLRGGSQVAVKIAKAKNDSGWKRQEYKSPL